MFLVAAYILLAEYARVRFAHIDITESVLWSFALLPTTLFFRMTYSESLFFFTMLLALYSIVRQWPMVLVALVVGAATAERPVGVALLGPLAIYARDRLGSWPRALLHAIWLIPLATWGLTAYMLFQQWHFGDALAFAKTQEHWSARFPVTFDQKATALIVLEPLWSVYLPNSESYWRLVEPESSAWFSLVFANPLFVLATCALILVGWWKRWLSAGEILLSAGLLFVSYATRAYEMCMWSQGRFAAVVAPAYLSLGHLSLMLPSFVRTAFACLAAVLLAVYSARFAAAEFLF
jgi:hypothetical protein